MKVGVVRQLLQHKVRNIGARDLASDSPIRRRKVVPLVTDLDRISSICSDHMILLKSLLDQLSACSACWSEDDQFHRILVRCWLKSDCSHCS